MPHAGRTNKYACIGKRPHNHGPHQEPPERETKTLERIFAAIKKELAAKERTDSNEADPTQD